MGRSNGIQIAPGAVDDIGGGIIGGWVEGAGAGSRRWIAALALGAVAAGCASSGGGNGEGGLVEAPGPNSGMEMIPVAPEVFVDTATRAFVVIDLDENILRFMHGDTEIWRAPVGTGTGLRLESEDSEWHFTTPRGVFQAVYKEEMPVWYLPDWYFIENKMPMPPQNDPSRKLVGQLGVAAVYLGAEIAIHGTDRPELLGQRVSHGCIRLENKYAQRLYHNVQIGTPIVIVGGESLDAAPPPPARAPGSRPQPPDPLAGVPTDRLLADLTKLLEDNDRTAAWVPVASRLITRGLKDDAVALRGLLSLAGTPTNGSLSWEYDTFLADAFSRGALRVVVSLARIDDAARTRATRSIVSATMSLYSGRLDDAAAPWPTHRMYNGVLGPEGRAGWDALQEAEREYRAAPGSRTAMK
jgi:hypothetical protein